MSKYAKSGRERGSAIIGALFSILVMSTLLMGVGTFCVSHQTRVQMDTNYAKAMDLAEAGVNWEFNKLSKDSTTADTIARTVNAPFGDRTTSFTVQCVNRGTTTPWAGPGADLDVISTGTVDGVRRQIRVSCKGAPMSGDYAIFAMSNITLSDDPSIYNGSIGTNGKFTITARPKISGSISINGPTASWGGRAPGPYTHSVNPTPVLWPTVNQVADSMFPTGGSGINYLAIRNDNASKGLGPTLTKSVTLTSGNYYFTSIKLSGAKITFDNRNGPINIWVGPSGGLGAVNLSGGTSLVSLSKARNVKMYVGTKSPVHLYGTSTLDCGIYAYNRDSAGPAYGTVLTDDWPILNGTVLANTLTFTSNFTVNTAGELFQPWSMSYYGYDNSWVETNPR